MRRTRQRVSKKPLGDRDRREALHLQQSQPSHKSVNGKPVNVNPSTSSNLNTIGATFSQALTATKIVVVLDNYPAKKLSEEQSANGNNGRDIKLEATNRTPIQE